MNWRNSTDNHDLWFVLKLARRFDITPQAVRDLSDDEIMRRIGFKDLYDLVRYQYHCGNAKYYTKEFIQDLRDRGKL